MTHRCSAGWSASGSPGPGVTLVDDGALARDWGACAIDDEGAPAQRNVLIDDGVLTDYMWDLVRRPARGPAELRERPSRDVPAPPDGAHDQHVHHARRRGPRRDHPADAVRPVLRRARRRPGEHRDRRLRLRDHRGVHDRGRQDHRAGPCRAADRQRPRGAPRASTSSATTSRPGPACAARTARACPSRRASRRCGWPSSPSAGPPRERGRRRWRRRERRAGPDRDRTSRGAARDGEQVEAYVVRSRETEIKVFGGEVESLAVAEAAGIGVRVVADGRQGIAYAGSLDADVVAERARRRTRQRVVRRGRSGVRARDAGRRRRRRAAGARPLARRRARHAHRGEGRARDRGRPRGARVRRPRSGASSRPTTAMPRSRWRWSRRPACGPAIRRTSSSVSSVALAGERDETQTGYGFDVAARVRRPRDRPGRGDGGRAVDAHARCHPARYPPDPGRVRSDGHRVGARADRQRA